eukprot:scaffold6701_cov167-Skeletonema_menzelii.AAC.1
MHTVLPAPTADEGHFHLPRATTPDHDGHTNLWQDGFLDFLFGAAEHITTSSDIVLLTIDWKGLPQVP